MLFRSHDHLRANFAETVYFNIMAKQRQKSCWSGVANALYPLAEDRSVCRTAPPPIYSGALARPDARPCEKAADYGVRTPNPPYERRGARVGAHAGRAFCVFAQPATPVGVGQVTPVPFRPQ